MNLHMPQDEEAEAELKIKLAKRLDAGNSLESQTTAPVLETITEELG